MKTIKEKAREQANDSITKELEIAISYCRDHEQYPRIFTDNYGIGITFKDDENKEYTSVLSGEGKSQEIILSITSFVGMGGIHWYGTLDVYPPCLMEREGRKIRDIGGYFDRFKPKEARGIKIELVRPVKQDEIDADPTRWEDYEAGDMTNAFSSHVEVVNVALLVFHERFQGQWTIREY
jgi:hypothetical protein